MQIWLQHSLLPWPQNTQGQSLSFPLFLLLFLWLPFSVPAFLPFHFAFLSSFLSLFLFNNPFRIRKKLKAVPGNLCCIPCGWMETSMLTWLQRLQHGPELTGLEARPGLTCQVRESLLLLYSALHCSGSVQAQWLALSTLARPCCCNRPEWGFPQPTVQSPGNVDGPTSLRTHFLLRLHHEVVKCSMTSFKTGSRTAAVRPGILTTGSFQKGEEFPINEKQLAQQLKGEAKLGRGSLPGWIKAFPISTG